MSAVVFIVTNTGYTGKPACMASDRRNRYATGLQNFPCDHMSGFVDSNFQQVPFLTGIGFFRRCKQ